MRHGFTWWIVLMLTVVALSGCAGKKNGNGSEPSAADAAANTYDRAIGNRGYRVGGSLTGTATDLGADSAVQLDIADLATTDGDAPKDKASLILDAKETGLNVQATLRSMASGASANSTGDHFGGAGRNVKVFGTTGVGPKELPETTAYLFAAGFANLKVGDAVQSKRLVYVAVTQGLRDANKAPLSTPDPNNLQIHVVVPGATMGLQPVDGVPGGFLYYYFEDVGLEVLPEADRTQIGNSLAPPEKVNVPPVADGKVLVGGKDASVAVQEGNSKANVSVMLDGSASTDEDGSVSRWVWRIFELSNGTYAKPADSAAVVQGQKVGYNFTRAGPKLINLTVVDNQGASHTKVIAFFVNFHAKLPGGGSAHSQAPIGGASCEPTVNCFLSTSIIQDGVVSATYTVTPNGTGVRLDGVTVEVYPEEKDDPKADTPVKEGESPLAVSKDDFKSAGRYSVWVWYNASTSAGGSDNDPSTLEDGIYDLEISVVYSV